MSASLLESLILLGNERLVPRVAARLGEPEQALSGGLRNAFAAILAALVARGGDAVAMRQVYALATDPANDGALLDAATPDGPTGLAALASAGPGSSTVRTLGTRLTSLVFDGRPSGAAELVARSSGIRHESASRLLALAAPLVLALLGRRIRDRRLDVAGLASMLASERDEIMRAAPVGLPSVDAPFPSASWSDGGSVLPARSARHPWRLVALATLAVLAFAWLAGRNRPDRAGRVTGAATGEVSSAVSAVSGAASDLGASVRRRLPDGRELDVPERGIESQLLAYLDDRSGTLSDTAWFEFDRLLFDTDEATLRPESQEQLRNIADILKAYPHAAVKVGGYTDNVGDPAANLRLSQRRAENVRAALADLGVGGDRLEAEGYGELHPIADNATEAGRTRNRRVALHVTRK
jgi:outer membrane protein OmpA-like peptidoglycan-associated protein